MIQQIFNQQFNHETMKQQILLKYETKSMNKTYHFKWMMIPICFLLVCNFLSKSINIQEDVIKPVEIISSDKENKFSIYINTIQHMGASKWDAEIKEVEDTTIIADFEELSNLFLPNDMNDTRYFEAYVKSIDKNSIIHLPKNDKIPYDKLFQYEICYQNPNNERSIVIAFSKDNIPFRDYHFSDEGSKVSIIHDVELTIYQYENLFLCNFTYQNINFDIETCGISEAELISLLTSIIQS